MILFNIIKNFTPETGILLNRTYPTIWVDKDVRAMLVCFMELLLNSKFAPLHPLLVTPLQKKKVFPCFYQFTLNLSTHIQTAECTNFLTKSYCFWINMQFTVKSQHSSIKMYTFWHATKWRKTPTQVIQIHYITVVFLLTISCLCSQQKSRSTSRAN